MAFDVDDHIDNALDGQVSRGLTAALRPDAGADRSKPNSHLPCTLRLWLFCNRPRRHSKSLCGRTILRPCTPNVW